MALIHEAEEQQEKLKTENSDLIKKVAMVRVYIFFSIHFFQWKSFKDSSSSNLSQAKPGGGTPASSEVKVTEQKYLNLLTHVHNIRMRWDNRFIPKSIIPLRLRQQQIRAAKMSEDLKIQLEEKRTKAIGIICDSPSRSFRMS